MSYHFSKTLDLPFDQAVARVTEALKREGFGILTDIDVKATIKSKLGEEFRAYRILGACNPPLAFRALQIEDKIGTMLPCNVIVQEHESGGVEVSSVDPVASMQAIDNPGLADVAKEVQAKLKRVVESTVMQHMQQMMDGIIIGSPEFRGQRLLTEFPYVGPHGLAERLGYGVRHGFLARYPCPHNRRGGVVGPFAAKWEWSASLHGS